MANRAIWAGAAAHMDIAHLLHLRNGNNLVICNGQNIANYAKRSVPNEHSRLLFDVTS